MGNNRFINIFVISFLTFDCIFLSGCALALQAGSFSEGCSSVAISGRLHISRIRPPQAPVLRLHLSLISRDESALFYLKWTPKSDGFDVSIVFLTFWPRTWPQPFSTFLCSWCSPYLILATPSSPGRASGHGRHPEEDAIHQGRDRRPLLHHQEVWRS